MKGARREQSPLLLCGLCAHTHTCHMLLACLVVQVIAADRDACAHTCRPGSRLQKIVNGEKWLRGCDAGSAAGLPEQEEGTPGT